MSPAPRGRKQQWHAPDGVTSHREWLSLVEVSGPFLSLPVLRSVWSDLDAVDKPTRERLRREHGAWQDSLADDPRAAQRTWITYILQDLLVWGDTLRRNGLDLLTIEREATLTPDFALVVPGTGSDGAEGEIKPESVRLLGLICPPGQVPTARIPGDTWAATPLDRLAQLCREHDVPLGLVTDGRFWTLLYAPRGGTSASATFDAISWQEAAERTVVRAFKSLLCRDRFFSSPENETLVPLFKRSEEQGEELTEALGVQVRQAVELLVAALGRADLREQELGRPGLKDKTAHDVYRGAVGVMMRIVFLLFAEERHLLPSDNDLYLQAYSAGHLRAELEARATEGSEEDLEYSTSSWHRLLALFEAIHSGIEHPRLNVHPHAGSLFNPSEYDWLPTSIDDRTVLNMLKAVQRVRVGTGKSKETRTVSFRALDVEQIGYVYEGLLAYEAFRAADVVVGLIGKEGLEEEVPLTDLETIAAAHSDFESWSVALASRYKDSRIGSAKAIEKALKPPSHVEREEARKKLLAVTDGDYLLAERLLPFYGLIRTDLRRLPLVILPGALYVTESTLRGSTGTHYTPQFLAREVAEHALQPLVYNPGPLQTSDESQWVPCGSAEILQLKVADIAMGSAAFLVAAVRYLGDRLVQSWAREGDEKALHYQSSDVESPRDADADPVVIEARRQTIEHCIYGVDINPMAVEMAKLSLWLVSMDPERSFAFVDDRLKSGDSLLGLTSLDQLAALHLEPFRGRLLNKDALDRWVEHVPPLVREVAGLRGKISSAPDQVDANGVGFSKESLLADADKKTAQLKLVGDLIVGAALTGKYSYTGHSETAAREVISDQSGRTIGDGHFGQVAKLVGRLLDGQGGATQEGNEPSLTEIRDSWLRNPKAEGLMSGPLHWPLDFPEVFQNGGGFDAVIGNPPFLGGQKLTGSLGIPYREYLIEGIGRGIRGSADLVAYFVLRAHSLLTQVGQGGLIATNTLAQGDTRRIGLDQLIGEGVSIRRSVKSRPWPSRSAVLEYCAVWTTRLKPSEEASRIADEVQVSGITSSLVSASRASGNPERLRENSGKSFQGSIVLGLGFTLEPAQAKSLIAEDPRNQDVLFPYVNGQDLNSHPDSSASRWVINFHDWPEERARSYTAPFDIVEREVKPERQRRNVDGTFTLRKPLPTRYWQYAEKRPAMTAALAKLDRAIVLTRHTKTVMPLMVPTNQVYSEATVVFATDDTGILAALSSAPHFWWAKSRGSSMKADLRYAPSDVFETFAMPESTEELGILGERLDLTRREIMWRRQLGLTKLYNLVFDVSTDEPDVSEMRDIHRLIDEAVFRAYGWEDLLEQGLDHGFHKAGHEPRFTVGPLVQVEILDRLLELNQERYSAEIAAGLHLKSRKSSAGVPVIAEEMQKELLF